MKRSAPGWLSEVLARARFEKMCTRVFCTTCGAKDFRLLARAESERARAREITINSGPEVNAAATALAVAMRDLSVNEVDDHQGAIRLLLVELARTMPDLDSRLAETPAGHTLAEMRVHWNGLSAARRKRELHDSSEATRARREAKRAAKQECHLARTTKYADRSQRLKAWLETLLTLNDVDRLKALASEHAPFPIVAVPQALLPRTGFKALTEVELRRLTARGLRPRKSGKAPIPGS